MLLLREKGKNVPKRRNRDSFQGSVPEHLLAAVSMLDTAHAETGATGGAAGAAAAAASTGAPVTVSRLLARI